MQITALTDAPLIIQIHVWAAVSALMLGPVALLRTRRDRWHRWAGRIWVLLMAGVAGSGLLISEQPVWGPFSPIHIFSVITFGGLIVALGAARRRDFLAHGRMMRALYAQALIVPGVFTFLPGRRMQALAGADTGLLAFVVAVVFGLCLMALIWFHPQLSDALRGAGKIPLFNRRQHR